MTFNDRWFRLLGTLVVSVFMTVVHTGWQWTEWLVSLLFTVVLWEGNRAWWRLLLRRFPRLDQTLQRLVLLTGGSVLYTLGASAVLFTGLEWALPGYPCGGTPCDVSLGFNNMWPNLIPSTLVITIYECIHFFQQWKANLQRAEQLARAGTQAQLDALQSQLDPHFLFNNLNTLAALIEPGNAPAQQFVEQLADVYRYVLLAQGKPSVPLADEMAFVETYVALHKARFRNNLVIETQLTPAALARQVAPLSVQLLVENALKHNVASQQHPLHLRLTASSEFPDFLQVENTLRPRTASLVPGTGTGLANIRQRYQLLNATRLVEVLEQEGRFVVKLPLL